MASWRLPLSCNTLLNNSLLWQRLQFSTKYLGTFSRFSPDFLQHKLNGTRLLSAESECTNGSKDECSASY